ncbi:transposase [Streptomyces sp. NPDC006463]|uniref:transposase n=1 Tax=Streptomyces sp. NPDC006463 TaxID=3364746 RepID=UPI003686E396
MPVSAASATGSGASPTGWPAPPAPATWSSPTEAWSVEFAQVFTATGSDLLVRLQSNHLGTVQKELPDGSYLSMARPGKEARLRAAREGRTLPQHVIYRVIAFAKDDKVAYLGTTLLEPEQYPAAELVALYRERWEIELAFDEIKNHLGFGGPVGSRTPGGVRQELWAYLAVHHVIGQFAHTAALARPAVDGDRVSYLKCVSSSAAASRPSSERPPPSPRARLPRQGGRHAAAFFRPGATGTAHARSRNRARVARPENPCQTRQGPAWPMGPQPNLEGEEQPQGWTAGTEGNTGRFAALTPSFIPETRRRPSPMLWPWTDTRA